MTTEMDLLRMDERQRLAWLMANRGTLIAVGLTWIGLIVRELVQGRFPLFLIVMVPAFAALRIGLFFRYCAAPVDLAGRSGRPGWGRRLKTTAAVLLGLSLFLPLYSFPGGAETGRARLGFIWDQGWGDGSLLAVALLWPVVTLALSGRFVNRRLAVLVQLAEPLLAALSVVMVLLVSAFKWRPFMFWIFLLGFESARPAAGTYLAVVANGLYFVAWLWEAQHPWILPSDDRGEDD